MAYSPLAPHPAGGAFAEVRGPLVDLNMQLSREQTAIMRSEAATDVESRAAHIITARDARQLIEETAFPSRAPHDFDVGPVIVGQPQAAARDLSAQMAKRLHDNFASGLESPKSFAHKSRVLRQAISRWGS